tara:strand:+ start:47 stop:562 length:516 start_codon:yes stop_codon:yes gene_type:complete
MSKKKKKKSVEEKLCDALEMEHDENNGWGRETELMKMEEPDENNIVKTDKSKDIEADYKSVRSNLYSVISKGNEAIDGILEVAHEGDSPRAYEVAAQMIKTVAEANKDLMELHKKVKDINKEEINHNTTTNNAIYVGSTKDLQELVNNTRSASRRLPTDDIVDAEVIEDNE